MTVGPRAPQPPGAGGFSWRRQPTILAVSRRWFSVVALPVVLLAACGGGDDGATASGQSTPSTSTAVPATTPTTRAAIEGEQVYPVEAGHAEGPLVYPQTPPVGGIHNAMWQMCAFYEVAVPNEKAVHSLEHGAVWVTYRPDLPAADLQSLTTLARSRDHIMVSRWDTGLASPIVVTAWGLQLRLDSVSDPRLAEFVRRYVNQGPEINAPC